MKKMILAAIMLIHFLNVYSQKNSVQYTDKEWQEMMIHLENKCESVKLIVNKKYKKRKIKKDLRLIKALNEITAKSYLNQSIAEGILKKHKVKIHSFPKLMDKGETKYIWYSLISGYMECELYLSTRDDGSVYTVNITMGNLDDFVCDEMGHAPVLNFHYVYQYLRPNAKFKIGFTGYEGGFVSQIVLNKST